MATELKWKTTVSNYKCAKCAFYKCRKLFRITFSVCVRFMVLEMEKNQTHNTRKKMKNWKKRGKINLEGQSNLHLSFCNTTRDGC